MLGISQALNAAGLVLPAQVTKHLEIAFNKLIDTLAASSTTQTITLLPRFIARDYGRTTQAWASTMIEPPTTSPHPVAHWNCETNGEHKSSPSKPSNADDADDQSTCTGLKHPPTIVSTQVRNCVNTPAERELSDDRDRLIEL